VNKYQKGIIFKMDNDSDEKYLIVGNEEINNNRYILIMPVEDLKNITVDYKKVFMAKVNSDDTLEIEDNSELIEKVVKETVRKEQIRNNSLKN
jgi:hypothetical protein